ECSEKLRSEFFVQRGLAGAQRDCQTLAKRAFSGASRESAPAVNQNPSAAQLQLTRRNQQGAFDFETAEIRVAIKHDRSTRFDANGRALHRMAAAPRSFIRPE